jgi:hypothetical protein
MLIALVLACAVDNSLNTKDNRNGGYDSGDPVVPPWDTDDSAAPPAEDCNGVDDDGDGAIDEDFPDANANGRADCLDRECPALDLATAGTVPTLEECVGTTTGGGTGETVTDPWNVRQKWAFRAPAADSSAQNSYAQPVIGNLDDDNGDGVIDEDDSPEVVVNVFGSQGYIVALDGATGTEKWSYRGSSTTAGVLIADVDSDGEPDVVGFDPSGRAIALSGTGRLKWTATRSPSSTSYPLVTVADLEGDGIPEVIADDLVLDGASGATRFSLNASVSNPYRIAAVADVDMDGDQEIFMTGTAYDSDGTTLWTTGEAGTYGFWPIVINADSDPEAEIGFVGRNWTLWDHDGTRIYSVSYGTPQPGPPCAGDFDGDGEAEVAWGAYQNFVAYELNGSPMWSVSMDDTSGLAGCSAWDVNGDGALEVLFADQTTFKIFDGTTGRTNWSTSNHRSGTVFEYPTVADADHDGHAEIFLASNYGASWGAISAWEHDGDGWPAAGSTWAIHDFAITNVLPDGTVPATPDPWWIRYNVYRARVAADDPSTPDLVTEITDVCVADCDYGPVAVGVAVANQGGADVEAGAILSLYAKDGAPRVVATRVLPAIPAGTRLEGIQFDLAPADIGANGFRAVVDDDGAGTGAVSECTEDNNADDWTDVFCP